MLKLQLSHADGSFVDPEKTGFTLQNLSSTSLIWCDYGRNWWIFWETSYRKIADLVWLWQELRSSPHQVPHFYTTLTNSAHGPDHASNTPPWSASILKHVSHFECKILLRGFVSKSARLLIPGMWWTSMMRLLTQSRMKWAWMSMCFIRECECGSWVHATVPWLSQNKVVGAVWGKPNSWNKERSQMICRAQCVQERYSASQEDRATTACCLELQAMGAPAHSTM